eukprot:TRINITY_DN2727_c0_g1_i1.p1 TRINITY_DN2727_c0_g1~~TRINITY_DN2727_c0_g1_i1.p1  ORF type:complete len:202 (+),score=14.35 TRINITY_DN2727_c0_g1_i1:274-879(+)
MVFPKLSLPTNLYDLLTSIKTSQGDNFFQYTGSNYGFYLDLTALSLTTLTQKTTNVKEYVNVFEVKDADMLRSFISIFCSSFSVPKRFEEPIFSVYAPTSEPNYRQFVAFSQETGKPVAVASYLIFKPAVAAIFEVGTLKNERKKGIAKQLLAHIITCLVIKEKCIRVVLHSSEMGRHLYSTLGFKEVVELPAFYRIPRAM